MLIISNHSSVVIIHQRQSIIKGLPIAEDAWFDSKAEAQNPTCLPSTRVELLELIRGWAHDENSKSLFWLNGMAGTGKSTISRTIAKEFANKGYLCASFFFKKGESGRGSAAKFFTTIAADLAIRKPETAVAIQRALDIDPHLATKDLQEQFIKLFQRPLLQYTDSIEHINNPAVVVIDALDECENDRDIKLLIHHLSQTRSKANLKIYITSRPQLPVRLGFSKIEGIHQDFILHEMSAPIIERDIASFLTHELASIREEHNYLVQEHRRLPINWPIAGDIQSLAQMAVPLFIFAATVCRFVAENRMGSPDTRLKNILDYQRSKQGAAFDQINATYQPVLNSLILDLSEIDKVDVISRFRAVVGPILVLAQPLSVKALAAVADISLDGVYSILDSLHSVLNIPASPTAPIRLFHLSFRDFLVNKATEAQNPFCIDENKSNSIVLAGCFKIMDVKLKQDICNLVSPDVRRSDIAQETVSSYIPLELEYACLYWIHHLEQMVEEDSGSSAQSRITQFVNKYFLYWLEVMSLLGKANGIIDLMNKLLKMLVKASEKNQSTTYSDEISFIQDSLRFILTNMPAIYETPLQIYFGALLFAPSQSHVKSIWRNMVSIPWVRDLPKTYRQWPDRLHLFNTASSRPISVSFSSDSKLLASLLLNGTVQIWQTDSGKRVNLINTLKTSGIQSPLATCIAWSKCKPNLIAVSFNPDRIEIWNSDSGDLFQTLEGIAYEVTDLVFSHDTMTLATLCEGFCLRVWDIETGKCIKSVNFSDLLIDCSIHSNLIYANSNDIFIAFLRMDQEATYRQSRVLAVWNLLLDESTTLIPAIQQQFYKLALSDNAKYIAAGTNYGAIALWQTGNETETGSVNPIHVLGDGRRGLEAIEVSKDCSFLITAGHTPNLEIWSLESGKRLRGFEGHSGSAHYAVVSPDAKLAASAGLDCTIQLWNIEDSILVDTTVDDDSHDEVVSIAISPNLLLVASGTMGGAIYVENANSRYRRLKTFQDDSVKISCMDFSHDSTLLASISINGIIRVWSLDSSTCVYKFGRAKFPSSGWIKLSPDSSIIISVVGSYCTIWQIETQHAIKSYFERTFGVCRIQISQDLQLAYVTSCSYADITITQFSIHDNDATVRAFKLPYAYKDKKEYDLATAIVSEDLTLLAIKAQNYIEVWRLETGERLLRFRIAHLGMLTELYSFDNTLDGHKLTSNLGSIHIPQDIQISTKVLIDCSDSWGYGFSSCDRWITYNGNKILWLPLGYKKVTSKIIGPKIIFTCSMVALVIVDFETDYLPVKMTKSQVIPDWTDFEPAHITTRVYDPTPVNVELQ